MSERELKIIGEAANLYKKYGIKSVTMDDVASHLGISKKTLYQYVKDKNQLVEKVVLEKIRYKEKEFMAILVKNLNAIDELLAINKYINTVFRDYQPSMEFDLQKYYPESYKILQSVRRKRMYETIHQNLIKGIKEGLYRKDLDIEIITKLHVFRCENIIENDLFTQDEITSSRFFNEIFKYHIHGIANEKGLKYFEKISINKKST